MNFATIGHFLQIPSKTIYVWYRQCLSGYSQAVSDGGWGTEDFTGRDGRSKGVPILKAENLGVQMTVDEKMIGEEFYTVMTNPQTGKIALLAETMRLDELGRLMDKMGDNKQIVKEMTVDLSPTYEQFCENNFPQATVIADKFHVVTHTVEAVQAVRLRLKQQELSLLPQGKKQRRQLEGDTRLINGETRQEMLTRSRYLLFKMESKWTLSQQKRALLLFETWPELKMAYLVTQQLRQWLDRSNVGKYDWQIERQLIQWYEVAEQQKIPEIENLIRLIGAHEQMIMNYFKKGRTNAPAEAMNGKIQRFITANYGVRDKDFFMYRLARYFS